MTSNQYAGLQDFGFQTIFLMKQRFSIAVTLRKNISLAHKLGKLGNSAGLYHNGSLSAVLTLNRPEQIQ